VKNLNCVIKTETSTNSKVDWNMLSNSAIVVELHCSAVVGTTYTGLCLFVIVGPWKWIANCVSVFGPSCIALLTQ